MPTYEFSCPNGHEFERFVRKISDGQSELPCPECGAIATRKVSGGAGLLFKGSGFYLTDYGKNAHVRKEDGKPPAGDKPSPPAETKAPAASETTSGSAAVKPSESAAANPRPEPKKPKPKE
jgi:putative FmdB family regulatory protein